VPNLTWFEPGLKVAPASSGRVPEALTSNPSTEK
jgi:hypothetical protein